MAFTVMYVAELCGKTGVFALRKTLPALREEYDPDFVIAGADSCTGGSGLGVQHAVYLRKLGVDCITMGECAFYKRDLTDYYPRAPWVLRPANYPADVPGRGWKLFDARGGRVAVIDLLGQTGFTRVHPENPFEALDRIAEKARRETPLVILDFHAVMSAEKRTMIRHADGKVGAVMGSHAKVMTADACVSGAGTASLTDCGRTGSLDSVGGMDPDARVGEYLSGIPVWASDGTASLEVQGCVLELDGGGRAVSIRQFRMPCKEKIDD